MIIIIPLLCTCNHHSVQEILHNQGVCCVYLKDYQKAIEHFQAAIALSPQTVSFVQLGRVYLAMGSVEDAIDVYKRAVKYVKKL